MSLFASAPAWANYACQGPVKGVTLSPAGVLSAEQIAGFSWVYICQVAGVGTMNTDHDTCKAIYAMLLAAEAQGKGVRLWFDDSLTCSTHPAWAVLTGWYWGPQLTE
jgi:hypothetical protein